MNSEVEETIVSTFIFTIAMIGFYGNCCFIVAVMKFRELRTTRALLLSTLCVMHLIVPTNFAVSRYMLLQGRKLNRRGCFLVYLIPPGIYASSHHAVLYLVLGIDIIFSIVQPIRYNNMSRSPYVLLMQTPCVAYGAFLLIGTFVVGGMDEPRASVDTQCLFADVYPPTIANLRIKIGMVINFSVLATYCIIIILLWKNRRKIGDKNTRAIGSVIVMTTTFLFSQFSLYLMAFFAHILSSPGILKFHSTFAIVYALPSYSLTYYVHLVISREYRRFLSRIGLCSVFGMAGCDPSGPAASLVAIRPAAYIHGHPGGREAVISA